MRAGSRRRRAATVLLAVLIGACGSGEEQPPQPEPRHPLTETVHRLQERFAASDFRGICALMTTEAQTAAGEVGHSDPTTCPKDVRKVVHLIRDGGGWLDGDPPRVAAVHTHGRVATVTLVLDGWLADVPFLRESSTWKLNGFFGFGASQFERIQRDVPGRPFPKPREALTVSDEHGDRCGAVSDAKYPRISGGCKVRVFQRSVPVEMLTPFGGFTFDDCVVDYRVVVDGDGRTWTDELDFEGPDAGGCADIQPCYRKRGSLLFDLLPWKGRIRGDGDGGLEHHMDACIRTCIGLFAGSLVLELTPGDTGSGWQAERTDSGATGFRLSDTLAIEGNPLDIGVTATSGGP